jgi:CubicO group peptidase (beta-lactamase class C family)
MIKSESMDRRRFITALAGAALVAPSLLNRPACAATPPAPRWKSVQRMLDEYVAGRKVAGAAAALSYGGGSFAYPSAGRIALDSPALFDENTLCRIYSMTKPVTGAAAMMLVEGGLISLDQPVADVLPEFRSLRVAVDLTKGLESRPAARTMTMRHLLTHTSGLGYWTPSSGAGALPTAYRERGITPGDYGAGVTRPRFGPQAKDLAEMVRRIAELPLASEPGTAWSYSVGADVMGLVVERVSGKAFDVFLRERVFGPLGMDSTGFRVAPGNAGRLATNYDVTPEGLKPSDTGAASVWLRPPTLLAGGARLASTARDFARFGAMYLGDGALGRARIMKPETARLARSNLLPAGVVYPNGGGFGAGARVVLPGSDRRFGTPGSFGWGGAAGTDWWIDPARRGNVVFMTQFMPPTSYPVRGELTAAIEADLGHGND